MKRIVIVGAGGHGREVLEIAESVAEYRSGLSVLGFVDEDEELHGQSVDGYPVLGGLEWLAGERQEGIEVICAVGRPRVMKTLVEKVREYSWPFISLVSPEALVSNRASVGRGVVIFPGVVVGNGAEIGDHVILNVGSTISHDSRLGPYCNVNPGAHVAGGVKVEVGAYIGMGANVMQNLHVGRWATVGGAAMVIGNVPDGRTVVGVPAERVRS